MKVSKSLAAAIALASISASAYAQTVTLDYSDQVSGTFTSLPQGWPDFQPLPTSTFDGSLSGSITYTLSNNIYVLTAEGFNITGASGTQFFDNEPFPFSYGSGGPNFCDGAGHCIDVQGPPGAPTGATVNTSNYAFSPDGQLIISASGVSASYLSGSLNLPCTAQFFSVDGGNTFVHTGPNIPVCTLTAASSSPGTWTIASTNAPEIDPGMAGSALTLLAGCVAMMRARKRIPDYS
jgi:hypothetical protein